MAIRKWLNILKEGNNYGNDEHTVDRFMQRHLINEYTINDDGTVDVQSWADISLEESDELPCRFGTIDGDFTVSHTNLKTFKGWPKKITGRVVCRRNMNIHPYEYRYLLFSDVKEEYSRFDNQALETLFNEFWALSLNEKQEQITNAMETLKIEPEQFMSFKVAFETLGPDHETTIKAIIDTCDKENLGNVIQTDNNKLIFEQYNDIESFANTLNSDLSELINIYLSNDLSRHVSNLDKFADTLVPDFIDRLPPQFESRLDQMIEQSGKEYGSYKEFIDDELYSEVLGAVIFGIEVKAFKDIEREIWDAFGEVDVSHGYLDIPTDLYSKKPVTVVLSVEEAVEFLMDEDAVEAFYDEETFILSDDIRIPLLSDIIEDSFDLKEALQDFEHRIS